MPIPLAAIPAIIGGAQAIGGLIGKAVTKRPKYKIPQSARQATALAAIRAQGDMPGYTQAQSNLNLMTSNAIAGARESGFAGEQLSSIMGQQEAGYRNLAAQNEQFQSQADIQYQQALYRMGQMEDQQWQMNEFAPYADKSQLFSDMVGAGFQNLFNAGNMLNQVPGGGAQSPMTPLTALPTRPGPVQSMNGPQLGQIPIGAGNFSGHGIAPIQSMSGPTLGKTPVGVSRLSPAVIQGIMTSLKFG